MFSISPSFTKFDVEDTKYEVFLENTHSIISHGVRGVGELQFQKTFFIPPSSQPIHKFQFLAENREPISAGSR